MIGRNFYSRSIEKFYLYIFIFIDINRKFAENMFIWVSYRLIWMIAIEKKIMKFDKNPEISTRK